MKSLKHYREEAGLSQFKLAQKSNVQPGLISGVEVFNRNLTKETAQKLSKALNIDAQVLYDNHHRAEVFHAAENFKQVANKGISDDDATDDAIAFVKFLVKKAEDKELLPATRRKFIGAAKTIIEGIETDAQQLTHQTGLSGRDVWGRKTTQKGKIKRNAITGMVKREDDV